MEEEGKLSVGVPAIDGRHRAQASLIDALERVTSEGNPSHAEVQSLLSQLVEETAVHFAEERDLMVQTRFPGTIAHVREHDRLLRHISALLSGHASGRTRVTAFTARSLREWLLQHIEGSDRALGKHVSGRSREKA